MRGSFLPGRLDSSVLQLIVFARLEPSPQAKVRGEAVTVLFVVNLLLVLSVWVCNSVSAEGLLTDPV